MPENTKTIQIYIIGRDPKRADRLNLLKNESSDAYTLLETEEPDGKTDTIVVHGAAVLTDRWILHLVSCAESYVNVGTVSPLTAMDIGLEPAGGSPSTLADAFEVCGGQFYPEVKHNLFDCVYIKKEVFEEAGIPGPDDMLKPDRMRAWFESVTQMGWKHKVCTQALLMGGYLFRFNDPLYAERKTFLYEEVLCEIQRNLKLYFDMRLDNGRKNILHYLLADFQEGASNNVGGTQFHVSDLVLYQKNVYNVFVLARDGSRLRLTEYTDDVRKVFTFYVGEAPDYNIFFDEAHEKLYDRLLAVLRISLVHVHHTMWMPLNIYYSAEKLGVPIILSIHDYYYACPALKMLDMEGKSCSRESCRENCDACLKANRNLRNGGAYMKKWYKEHGRVISMCKRVVFPSEQAKSVLSEHYPEIAEKGTVIGHGIVLPAGRKTRDFVHDRPRVAFIGGISDVKGGPVIFDLITQDNKNFDWYLMGGIACPDLYHLEQENLTKTGWYKRYEIYDLLLTREIDLVCILSTVEETFCYTLSEAVAAGIPVVATNVGALGQRMRRLECGWLVPREADAKDIYELLLKIKNNPSEYREKYHKTVTASIKDLSVMGSQYDELYSKAAALSHTMPSGDIGLLRRSCESNTDNDDVEQRSLEEKAQLIADQKELYELKSSLLVRWALELRKIQIPGKEKLKQHILKTGLKKRKTRK